MSRPYVRALLTASGEGRGVAACNYGSAENYGREIVRRSDETWAVASHDPCMTTLREAAEEFLAQDRIAVAGVSRDTQQPANLIYRRLRATGHEVFAVNPNADEVEGDQCYARVSDIPAAIDGVVVVTPPEVAPSVIDDCAAAHVPRVWLHRGIGPGSLSDDAVAACRRHGIAVIPGACPNMFGATSDRGHRGMLRILQLTGKLPRRLEEGP
jgi:predicted CoA-binding protein